MVYVPSSGTYIWDTQRGTWLKELSGYRLYLFVSNGTLVPDFLRLLHSRLTLAGLAFYKVSSSGSLLERSPVDLAMTSAHQPDFVGGAVCDDPLEQRRPKAEIINADAPFLDLSTLIPSLQLSSEEESQRQKILQSERQKVQAEAQEKRERWLEERSKAMSQRNDCTLEEARKTCVQALETSVLEGSFALKLSDGREVSVREIMAAPHQYDGLHAYDPLEPDYHDDPRIAKILVLDGRPRVTSFAHGFRTYQLQEQHHHITLVQGKTYLAVDETARYLRENEGLHCYDSGDALFQVVGGHKKLLDTDTKVTNYLARAIQYLKPSKDDGAPFPVDPPIKVVQGFIAQGQERKLPQLDAVSDMPIIRTNNTLVTQRGYDKESHVYLTASTDWNIPELTTEAQIIATAEQFWYPLSQFPYDGALSKTLAFSGLLTALTRSFVPTAPGILVTSPTAGTGKTKLASVLSILASDELNLLSPNFGNKEEFRKELFSVLINGGKVLFIDNCSDEISSSSLEAFLTADVYQGRLLGVNRIASAPNRVLTLLTGNNANLKGDLNRRLQKIRIDAKMELPGMREFHFDPVDWTRQNRGLMITQGVALLQAYFQAGTPQLGKGKTASFERWDELVRQPVCWLASLAGNPLGFVDPIQAFAHNYEDDSDRETLGAVLICWESAYGSTPKLLREVLDDLAYQHEDLKNALLEATGKKSLDKLTSQDLSNWAKKKKERIVNNLSLETLASKRKGSYLWQVKHNGSQPSTTLPQLPAVVEQVEPLSLPEPPDLNAILMQQGYVFPSDEEEPQSNDVYYPDFNTTLNEPEEAFESEEDFFEYEAEDEDEDEPVHAGFKRFLSQQQVHEGPVIYCDEDNQDMSLII